MRDRQTKIDKKRYRNKVRHIETKTQKYSEIYGKKFKKVSPRKNGGRARRGERETEERQERERERRDRDRQKERIERETRQRQGQRYRQADRDRDRQRQTAREREKEDVGRASVGGGGSSELYHQAQPCINDPAFVAAGLSPP